MADGRGKTERVSGAVTVRSQPRSGANKRTIQTKKRTNDSIGIQTVKCPRVHPQSNGVSRMETSLCPLSPSSFVSYSIIQLCTRPRTPSGSHLPKFSKTKTLISDVCVVQCCNPWPLNSAFSLQIIHHSQVTHTRQQREDRRSVRSDQTNGCVAAAIRSIRT